MIQSAQFELMAETLFWAVAAGPRSGPDAWRVASDPVKDSWRGVVERQLRAANVPFERVDLGREW